MLSIICQKEYDFPSLAKQSILIDKFISDANVISKTNANWLTSYFDKFFTSLRKESLTFQDPTNSSCIKDESEVYPAIPEHDNSYANTTDKTKTKDPRGRKKKILQVSQSDLDHILVNWANKLNNLVNKNSESALDPRSDVLNTSIIRTIKKIPKNIFKLFTSHHQSKSHSIIELYEDNQKWFTNGFLVLFQGQNPFSKQEVQPIFKEFVCLTLSPNKAVQVLQHESHKSVEIAEFINNNK